MTGIGLFDGTFNSCKISELNFQYNYLQEKEMKGNHVSWDFSVVWNIIF